MYTVFPVPNVVVAVISMLSGRGITLAMSNLDLSTRHLLLPSSILSSSMSAPGLDHGGHFQEYVLLTAGRGAGIIRDGYETVAGNGNNSGISSEHDPARVLSVSLAEYQTRADGGEAQSQE